MFALGRAQELCILLETYWDRMNLKVPIYFSLGLTEKVGKIDMTKSVDIWSQYSSVIIYIFVNY